MPVVDRVVVLEARVGALSGGDGDLAEQLAGVDVLDDLAGHPGAQAEGFVLPEDTGPRMEEAVARFGREDFPAPGSHRVWFDRGTVDLDEFYGPTQDALKAALLEAGYVEGKDLEARVYDGTGHFETWWQARAAEALAFLLKRA